MLEKTSCEIPGYPRMVTPEWKPYDPLELAKETEKIVCRNNERKYTAYCAGVYGGIATAYVAGCCLRCIFCWVDPSRDYPERYGKFLSPEKVYAELERNALSAGFRKLHISGGEPTICKQHLLRVLELVEALPHPLVIRARDEWHSVQRGQRVREVNRGIQESLLQSLVQSRHQRRLRKKN